MGSQLRMAGSHGEVRWGYHRAATVTTWSLEWGILQAALAEADPIRLAQRPLAFVVSNAGTGRPDFSRELLNVVVRGATLTARLGPRR
jgi:hypothetical protein